MDNKLIINIIEYIGQKTEDIYYSFISGVLFIKETFIELITPPYRIPEILQSMEFIGNQSLSIILLSGFAIGAVFGLQTGIVFSLLNAESVMGAATAKSLTRELAPMMTAFLVTGRAGSSITAEIATMKVNEQIDALESMGVSPINFLVVPKIIASIIVTPLLSGIFTFIGVLGAFVIGVYMFDVDQGMFFNKIIKVVYFHDIWMGMQKACIFSIVIILIACKFGLSAKGGAKGVGLYTTNSVVVTLLSLLSVDFLMSFLQTMLGSHGIF